MEALLAISGVHVQNYTDNLVFGSLYMAAESTVNPDCHRGGMLH